MPDHRRPRRVDPVDGVAVLLMLLVAYALKRHYSVATAEDLSWILRPTAALVETATGAAFVMEPGEGYVSPELNLLIAPSCAGVNFLIAAFCSGVLGLLACVHSPAGKVLLLLASGGAAYVLAVLANTVRLVIGVRLADLSVGWPGVSPEQFHRLEGVAVYFGILCLSFLLARWLARDRLAPLPES